MTEPTVKVSNNAAPPFNLSFNAKVPTGNPAVSTEGDLMEVIKKSFLQNGASWTVGMRHKIYTDSSADILDLGMASVGKWERGSRRRLH